MADSTSDDHEKRVRDAFDSLHKNVGERMDDDARRSVEGLRTAAASRDRDQLRSGLTDAATSRLAVPGARRASRRLGNLLNKRARPLGLLVVL